MDNIDENFRIMETRAMGGDPTAQCTLGWLYSIGVGVEQDHTLAARWYKAAAEQGNSTAQSNLAISYEQGLGVAQDIDEARKWYERAASGGQLTASYNLGRLLLAADVAVGVKCVGSAAERAHASGQHTVRQLYGAGEHPSSDYQAAL